MNLENSLFHVFIVIKLSVDVDTVLRKEPDSDCVTPSNPLGLAQGHGIPPGEGLHIFSTLEKLADTQNSKASAEKVK